MSLKGRRVLFISYNEMLGGLGQSQVLPYLRALSRHEGVRYTLLSYERDAAYTPEGKALCAALKENLAADGIDWHWLRYHQRPSLPATMYDVAAGVRLARRLVRQHGIEMIHARSHIPAVIAWTLKKTHNLKLIFDLRGLMAEEYVDAGHWRKDSLPFRLTKTMERRAFAVSDGIVTLTEAIWPVIRDWEGLRGRGLPHEVVPCCADLDRFHFDTAARAARREELSVQDKFVVVYSGSLVDWYPLAEMADFCAEMARLRRDAFFLWLTASPPSRVHEMMQARGLDALRYTIRAAPPDAVPSYLSASDAGLIFNKPCFSRMASSPVKIGEYLACGLPLILSPGTGDAEMLVTREKLGALVPEFTPDAYRRAIQTLSQDFADAARVRAHSRHAAERLFDLETVALPRYAALYRQVLHA